MMKSTRKLLVTAALILPFAAQASDGTITVNGNVSNETCTIIGNGASGTSSFTVSLAKVGVSALSGTVGKMAAPIAFTIAVSGCTGTATSVNAYFEPGTNVNTNNILTNTGTAGNVGVAITTTPLGTPISFSSAAGSQGITAATLGAGAASQTFYAQYYALTAAPTSGTYSTTFTYSLVYN